MNVKGEEVYAVAQEFDNKGEGFKAWILRKGKSKIDALTLTLNFLQSRVNSYHPEQDDRGEKAIRKTIREEISNTRKRIKETTGINLITDIERYEAFGMKSQQV